MLKIDDVEGELVRPVMIRDGAMLRDQVAQQAQKIAPSPLQLKIASILSRDNEIFLRRPWILTTKDDIPRRSLRLRVHATE